MSRLFLKNLPNWITENKLMAMFSKFGIVTDIKLFKDKKKKNFGFVGFFEKKDAKKALNELNSRFFGNKKITVENAFSKKISTFEKEKKNIFIKHKFGYQKKESSDLIEKTYETGKIFIRNFSNQCSSEDIKNLLNQFGFVSSFFFYSNKSGKKLSNEAFVQFALPECALKAALFLDGKIFRGRILHVLPFFFKSSGYHSKKEEFLFSKFKKIRKKIEVNNRINSRFWFTLFVSSESLVKILVSKYGKTQKIMKNYENIKLNLRKMTITEARLQNETKKILNSQGIDINVFNPIFISKKSRRIFFLKNFGECSIIYFKKTLKKFGKITKLVYVYSTSFILVEFQKKKDANMAFLYLEQKTKNRKNFLIGWAPVTLNKNFKNDYQKNKSKEKADYFFSKNSSFFKEKQNNLFVSKCSKQKKKNDLKKDGIEYRTQFTEMLFFKNQERQFNEDETFRYKILVRNIPFRVNLEKIKKIFENFGQIVSIRMPKNKIGKHRGFAFVEFKNLEEAKKTVLATQNIHLLSRHLYVSLLKHK